MAKTEKPKPEETKEVLNPKFEKAVEELRQAEQAYYELVRQNTAGMPEEQKQQHQQACQSALTAKREAKRVIEDLRLAI